jgi:flagellar hook protein FlgE
LNALDLAISGQGFFAMKPSLTSSQTVYTRNGSFSVNNDRYVVDSKGQYLQVFPVNADGSVTSTSISSAQNLQLPVNSGLPSATTKIQLGLNLPADATIIPNDPKYTVSNPYEFNRTDSSTFNQSTSITIYDSLGNPTIATIYYVKTSNATEISPFNKWQTHVYVGDKELDPALITAKDEQGRTLYINKFGEVTSDPQSKDSTFLAGAPHPLYKYDDQTEKASSTAAQATGINIKSLGFDFGDTDSNTVTITSNPSDWADTREGGNTDAGAKYWGQNMFTISDGNSQPVSVSIRDGNYTGTALAAELTRAVNEAFGDDKFVKITDTYLRSDGETIVPGNDIIKLNLFALDDNGTAKGLVNPIEIDLLGNSGSIGTAPDSATSAAPERDLQLTRSELVDLVQTRLNEAMTLRAAEFGKTSTWVNQSDPDTWPITVGYDASSRSLTFTPNRNLIGPNASELQARFNSMQVFSPTASNLGIPTVQTSANTLIRAGSVWTGNELVPNGDPVLDPADHRYGIKVAYNKDTRQFSFISGSTGEDSAIRVGRALLNNDAKVEAQVDAYDLSGKTLAVGESISIMIDGKSFSYTNAGASALTGSDLVDDLVAEFNTQVAASPQNIAEVQEITFANSPSDTAFIITVGGINVTVEANWDGDQIAQAVAAALDDSPAFDNATISYSLNNNYFSITYDNSAGDVPSLAVSVPSNILEADPSFVAVEETTKGANLPSSIYTLTAESGGTGKLLVTGKTDGSKFNSTVRIEGTVIAKDAVGASGSSSVAGIMLGSIDLGSTDDSPFLGANNDLLGIGLDADAQVQKKLGTGLPATSAIAVGSRAITSLAQTFVPNESLGENRMTFTIDGIVGTVTLPVRAYTGDTFASSIEERVNLIEDPENGRTVSGVKVRFDPDNNRLIFTSGTTGSNSQINVVGSPNYGLRNVTTTQGQIPVITVLKQAEDADQNKLYIDADGNITTQQQETPNWVPLYLNQGQLTFDTIGKLASPKEGVVYSPFDPGNGSNLINLNVDYGKFSTQYAQPFSVLSLQQDGFTSGKLDGLNIDASGTVRANYTNGQTQALGKIMLANFANPNGLKQVGNSNYVATSVSGDANLGQAGGDGFGSIQSGSLERSNVDITEELVNLITAQRNFQANSKAIETETTLTQTIIQIRG